MMTRESHDSTADHYQQASLHLEAAAEHLGELIALKVDGYSDYLLDEQSRLLTFSSAYERCAQAALQETK